MQENNMVYIAVDGDNAGRMVGRAVLANDEAALADVSARIDQGQVVAQMWLEGCGGQKISGGGDEMNAKIPASAIADLEQLRSDYQFATQLTLTVGVGSSLSEAGKSLMAGKFRGKDQIVQYDPSVDQELAQAQSNVANGTGTDEEKKISESYLNSQGESVDEPDHEHTDDCQYCEESEPAHDHTDDCAYCQESEQEESHDHTDDCEYCAATNAEPDHEHGDDCQYCQEADSKLDSHEHTDDCQYCADAPAQDATQQLTGELSQQTGNENSGDIAAIDDTDMPVGSEMDGNISRPEGYADGGVDQGGEADEGMGSDPNLHEVLKTGLDNHADSIKREKVVNLIAQALEGFKANKQILEKAKEQAPALYQSTIAMLKAMIEMGKMLGLESNAEAESQDPQAQAQPQQSQAAPQEGAAQSPQQ